MNEKHKIARKKFEDRIAKGMLGPGSDTWGISGSEEIISDYPLLRYFTAVLFPKSEKIYSEAEADDKIVEAETNEKFENDEGIEGNTESDSENSETNLKMKVGNEDYEKVSQNNFFPNNIGLTICVENGTKEIDVTFSFGVYYQPKLSETKIKISERGFKSFFDSQIPLQLSFKNKLKFDGKFMALEKELEGKASKVRSGDYKDFDDFKSQKGFSEFEAYKFVWKLEKLLGRKWKRKEIDIHQKVKIENQPIAPLELPFLSHKSLKVAYSVKKYNFKGLQFVKIQLINDSDEHPRNKFSNLNETLNSKCLFQSKIRVASKNIIPYKNYREEFPFDDEAEKLNFVYRKIKNYSVGHNCSVTWKEDAPKEIETTFLPKIDIPDTKNDLEHLSDSRLDEILMIKNLSSFGFDKDKTTKGLKYFVSKYENWINEQSEQRKDLNDADKKTAFEIIEKQKENLERLENNIELLDKNEDIFQAFQLSNLAMFIQLIISNDKEFAKEEKDLTDLKEEVEYDDLNYFLNHNFEPKYRPFQLAFLLLNVDGVVNKESKSRKEIVDLIWFPTGGGKTEAYLAVTAFTIIWRRLKNPTKFGGTTIIMRYTLRLLTAQQFERASRLIATLEFLRKQNEYKNILKNEPISIGLWIGQSSTPNTLKKAFKEIDEIDKGCDKNSGNPQSKNKFQISSCPWCGTKIISKGTNGNWDYGFRKKRKNLDIYCLNKKCPFSNKIPVHVVDEALYKNPPTLLFGTVDKFAQLAWQEGALAFFNRDNENLPPDLIIQDELHLLSGPLGSITGIFESVIELLCTKSDVPPKIIASTATTRNTNEQVGKLYGNRDVNIFPPTGINYTDSFFAKESKEQSKRRYFGFLPTGKTALITQLQILAHLLVARLENYSENVNDLINVNDYWTIVSYYNSLKDVGKTYNKVGDEILTGTSQLQTRLKSILKDDFYFNYGGLVNRTKELTSRIESEKIKATLKELEEKFTQDKISIEKEKTYLNNVVDLVLATNMISVGIDISRLNIMLMNGMPKNVAEYIQASSRVGRKTFGLVVTLLDANRPREKSYFEHFQSFHRAFYKSVEPLSVTPFTENTISKMLSSLLVSFIRQYYPELNANKQAEHFTKEKIDPLLDFFKIRFSQNKEELSFCERGLKRIADDWISKIEIADLKNYKDLLKTPDSKTDKNENNDWITMNSMREIDTNTFIRIKEI